MSSGWLFLGLTALICFGVFVSGVRFARMTANPWAGKRIGRLSLEGSDLPVSSIRRFGYLQMIGAPIFLLFAIALSFGLLGPVDGIQTIKF